MAQTLDLTRPRDVGDLLGTTFQLFGRFALLFGGLTVAVVAPVVVLVDGLWGGYIEHGPDRSPGLAPLVASGLLYAFVLPATITALHVVAVQMIGRGERPTARRATRRALERLAPAVGAVALSTLAVLGGLILCIVPGIWLAVRLYFTAQSAVVLGVGPVGAVRASAGLVAGRWWRTAGLLVLGGLVFGLAGGLALAILPLVTDSGLVWLAVTLPLQTVVTSLSALYGTLLFFDLRARRLPPPLPGPTGDPAGFDPSLPERPRV